MPDYTPSHPAGADSTYTVGATAVAGGQVVALSAAETIIPTTGASVLVAGIALGDAPIGGRVAVSRGGIQRPTAGGTIAVGDGLKSAASGQVVPWVSASDNVNLLLGWAIEAATSGNPVKMLWSR